MLLLFLILVACVAVWFPLVARLERLLRTRQPGVYDSLGRPTLILNNTVKNGWAFLRFLLGGHFQKIDDPEIVRLCRFLRVFAICYFVFFIVVVACGLASGAFSSSL